MKELIKSLVDSYENQLLETRHHLHANPELSFEEYKTAEYIRENLTRMGIELQEGISGTSTVGILKVHRTAHVSHFVPISTLFRLTKTMIFRTNPKLRESCMPADMTHMLHVS